jgi:hypothetical protein
MKTFKIIFKIILKILLGLFVITIVFYGVWFLTIYLKVKIENEARKEELKHEHLKDSLECICGKIRSYKEIENGNVILYYTGNSPYVDYIALNEFGIHVQQIHLSGERIPSIRSLCTIAIMDSFINKKYGKDFIERIERKSDSIYKKRPDYHSDPFNHLDLDGFYLSSDKEVRYKCSEIKNIYNYIETYLKHKGLIPIKDTCSPKNLVLDFVISKQGKLSNIRILRKLTPEIDSTVISLLTNLPCDWQPAESKGEIVSFRYEMDFDFGTP